MNHSNFNPARFLPLFLHGPLAVCAIAAWLILSLRAVGSEAPSAESIDVFRCTFDEKWDVNYDSWPDRWYRDTGDHFPHYVKIGIQRDKNAPGGNCLVIHLDGAVASIASPPIRVMPRFNYTFEAQLKNDALLRSNVVLTLEFCDAKGRIVQSKRSVPIGTTKGWQKVRIDNIEPIDQSIDRVMLGLVVRSDSKGDLQGRVALADLRLVRKPRIAVVTNNPSNVYTSLKEPVISCDLSGIPERDPEIRFQLFDAFNRLLQTESRKLDGRLIVEQASDDPNDKMPPRSSYEGSVQWRPQIQEHGYYRVVVQMLSSKPAKGDHDIEQELASRTIYLAVVPPLPLPSKGEFGWTLPRADAPLSFRDLNRLLPQVGISWVKLPVWFSPDDTKRADELIRFAELLGASNIEVVGIIDQPPRLLGKAEQSYQSIPIAELLTGDTTTWASMFEPVMARLALRVRWWQLGRDGDLSFVGYPKLSKRVEDVRTALFRFGQDVRLGVNWDWAALDSSSGTVRWDFEQLSGEKPPTSAELARLLSKPREPKVSRWVTIQPTAREKDADNDKSALLRRSTELVRRMIAAKVAGADAIIVTNPFDEAFGLMHASGMPDELLLAWRTTASLLGGAEYLGEMQLPNDSENHVFLRGDGQVVMVVWSNSPKEETLYLGESVKQYDVFGRRNSVAKIGNEQTIKVDETPKFIVGLHEGITKWRMAFGFEKAQVPSIFAKPHANSLHFRNYFPQGVGGSMKIVVLQSRGEDSNTLANSSASTASTFMLDRWSIEPPKSTFQLAAGAEMKFPFEIELRNALFGKQPVRIDFQVEADEQYEFSVYSELEVGTEDLTLELSSYLDKDGTLIVEQLMTNRSEQLADFKCFLRARGHRRQRMQVYRLGKEVDRKLYRFSNGQELVGCEMLLEVEELNGPRELRYRFVAKDGPPPSEDDTVRRDRFAPAGAEETPESPAIKDVAGPVGTR